MYFLPGHRLQLYRNFKAIASQDLYGTVRYYEQFEEAIRSLDFEAYFDCTTIYTEALFATAQYGKHIVMCHHVLELVMLYNVDRWGGEDYYQKTLFDKAVSHFRLHEYPAAIHTLRELLKIYPQEPRFVKLLTQCLLQQRPVWLRRARAWFIVAVLLSALVIALEIFVVPFFPEYFKSARILHNTLLAAGIGNLLWSEGRHLVACLKSAKY